MNKKKIFVRYFHVQKPARQMLTHTLFLQASLVFPSAIVNEAKLLLY